MYIKTYAHTLKMEFGQFRLCNACVLFSLSTGTNFHFVNDRFSLCKVQIFILFLFVSRIMVSPFTAHWCKRVQSPFSKWMWLSGLRLVDECQARVQRKSVLQPAIWANCSQHVLAHKSFQLAPKPYLNFKKKKQHGEVLTKITSPIAKSTIPGLSDMTFFTLCVRHTHSWFRLCSKKLEGSPVI